jgi:dihydroorotate dehydrogenase
MRLRGIEYGSVFCAPGARGFAPVKEGDGAGDYFIDRVWRYLGLTWKGTTFCSKTVTLDPREGSMPMGEDRLTPRELFPRCIWFNPLTGDVVNNVGLSNPGLPFMLKTGQWQALDEPFCISIGMVGDQQTYRLRELDSSIDLLGQHLPDFSAKDRVAIQVNFGCPNVHGTKSGQRFVPVNSMEVSDVIAKLNRRLDLPLIANFSPVAEIDLILAAARHDGCDALWIANTIPWGHPDIDWQRRFGTTISPLVKRGFGPGGYSGSAATPITCRTIKQLRALGVSKPIVGGNSVRRISDVGLFADAGADSIALGTGARARPWRMKGIIAEAYACFGP